VFPLPNNRASSFCGRICEGVRPIVPNTIRFNDFTRASGLVRGHPPDWYRSRDAFLGSCFPSEPEVSMLARDGSFAPVVDSVGLVHDSQAVRHDTKVPCEVLSDVNHCVQFRSVRRLDFSREGGRKICQVVSAQPDTKGSPAHGQVSGKHR
jgi:hypothetical protein